MSNPYINVSEYIGMKSGKLTVIGLSKKLENEKRYHFDCLCECGNITRLYPYQIKNKSIKSCGCIKKNTPSYIDGRSKNKLYPIWFQMISRCENKNATNYSRYGAKGIKVCDEWHDFWNFVKWCDSIGGKPENTTLDRIDYKGNYCPENCRWATNEQQANNKSSNIYITYNGKTQTLKEWSIETGLSWPTLHHRYERGWDVEKMLTTPNQRK